MFHNESKSSFAQSWNALDPSVQSRYRDSARKQIPKLCNRLFNSFPNLLDEKTSTYLSEKVKGLMLGFKLVKKSYNEDTDTATVHDRTATYTVDESHEKDLSALAQEMMDIASQQILDGFGNLRFEVIQALELNKFPDCIYHPENLGAFVTSYALNLWGYALPTIDVEKVNFDGTFADAETAQIFRVINAMQFNRYALASTCLIKENSFPPLVAQANFLVVAKELTQEEAFKRLKPYLISGLELEAKNADLTEAEALLVQQLLAKWKEPDTNLFQSWNEVIEFAETPKLIALLTKYCAMAEFYHKVIPQIENGKLPAFNAQFIRLPATSPVVDSKVEYKALAVETDSPNDNSPKESEPQNTPSLSRFSRGSLCSLSGLFSSRSSVSRSGSSNGSSPSSDLSDRSPSALSSGKNRTSGFFKAVAAVTVAASKLEKYLGQVPTPKDNKSGAGAQSGVKKV
jgi:hypothetical protein